jgi:hypothetical protein
LSIDPNEAEATARLVELYSVTDQLDQAIKWCDKLSQIPGQEISAIVNRARAYVYCGDKISAKNMIFTEANKRPTEPEILIAAGDVAMAFEGVGTAISNAIQAYSSALQIVKSRSGDVQWQNKIHSKLDAAEAALREIIQQDQEEAARISPLFMAIEDGNTIAVQSIIETGIDLNLL